MKSLLFLLIFFPWLLQSEVDSFFFDEPRITAFRNDAESGDANSQLIMGILLEIGYGVPQSAEEAASWYWLAAKQGNPRALKRLGALCCLAEAAPEDKILGMALILLGSFTSDTYWKEFEFARKDLAKYLNEDELTEAFHIAMNWRAERAAVISMRGKKDQIFHLISDRPDPQDANDLFYGPGTHDGNIGIFRSEYERQKREYDEFIAKLEDLKTDVELNRLTSVHEKIQALEKTKATLQDEALKDLLYVAIEVIGARASVSIPPLSVFALYKAIENAKEFTEIYRESIDVQKEIQSLLDLERSLEKSRELHGSGRER